MKREETNKTATQALKEDRGPPGPHHPLTGLLAIHETLGNGVRSEDLISGGGAATEDRFDD